MGSDEMTEFQSLDELTAKGDFERARIIAKGQLSRAEDAAHRRVWLFQLALIDFQDESLTEPRYITAQQTMATLCSESPNDADFAFWRGYMASIYGDPVVGEASLRRSLQIDPGHPYANLVVAKRQALRLTADVREHEAMAAIGRCLVVLAAQRGNRGATRSLRQLAKGLRLKLLLEWVTSYEADQPPYVEDGLGAGDTYANRVLNESFGGGLR